MSDAVEQADSLLNRVWSSADVPVPLPVDPIYIAAQLGMDVRQADLDEGLAGMLVKKAGQDPVIYLNEHDSSNRQRFTCAHEIGHYVNRVDRGDDRSWEFVDRRDHVFSRGTHRDEVFANRFAAELLMPADRVRDLASALTAADMAAVFRVSLEAMTNRLDTLGVAPGSTRR